MIQITVAAVVFGLLLSGCGKKEVGQDLTQAPAAPAEAPATPEPTVIPPEHTVPFEKSIEQQLAEEPPPPPPEVVDTVTLKKSLGGETIRLRGDLVKDWSGNLARHGKWKTYYPGGTVRSVENYELGARTGSSQLWGPRGELLADVDFSFGQGVRARLRCTKEICPARNDKADEVVWMEFAQGIMQHYDRVTSLSKTASVTFVDLMSSTSQTSLTTYDHFNQSVTASWPAQSPVPIPELSAALKHLPVELFGKVVSTDVKDERGWPLGSFSLGVKRELRRVGDKDELHFMFDSTPSKDLGTWGPYAYDTFFELGKHVRADLFGIGVDQAGVRGFPVDKEMDLNSPRLVPILKKWPGFWTQALGIVLRTDRINLISYYFPDSF